MSGGCAPPAEEKKTPGQCRRRTDRQADRSNRGFSRGHHRRRGLGFPGRQEDRGCDRLGESFVGSLLLAAATSLPEAVVSIGALRLGRADMAVSNLLGSNLFNMVTISVCDALYRPGALLKDVSPAGLMSGLTALVMTGIVITALVYRKGAKSAVRIGFEAVALGFVYLMGSYFIFVLSRL
jgi:Ca2+/Na+ antiporter